jgi:NADP-dependent 3-hydroxy acid dehydrogenase YdfG
MSAVVSAGRDRLPPPGLDGALALVTGASGTIGRALTAALSSLGARVCLVGRSASRLAAVAAQLTGPALAIAADLTESQGMKDVVTAISAQFGGQLDILVHCAGGYSRAALDVAPIEELDRLYEVNVRAPYRLTQLLLPQLKERGGHVVFINSTQSLTAKPTTSQYAATQHARTALANSLREEINADGVRVLTLYLGRIAGELQAKIFRDEGRNYCPELLIQPSDIAAVMAACLTLPPTAEVTSVTVRPAHKSY